MIVPENKIVVIPTIADYGLIPFNIDEIGTFLKPLKNEKKRDWFDKHFYKCLPISIGNLQGFVFSLPFKFDVFWNGKQRPEDLFFKFYDDEKKFNNKSHIGIVSHFGHGIITIDVPVLFKTPPNVSLMTIAPPNFLTPGMNPLTSVIETDNLRFTFTLNIKMNIENTWIHVKKDSPLIGIIPVPRNFCDSFDIVYGKDIFDSKEIEQERLIAKEHKEKRKNLKNNSSYPWDRTYFNGTDIRGNVFENFHQLP